MNSLLYTADAAFSLVLTASGCAAVIAVLVLAVCRIAGNLLSPRVRYALWLLVAVRLLLPEMPATRCSIFNVVPALMDTDRTDRGLPLTQKEREHRSHMTSSRPIAVSRIENQSMYLGYSAIGTQSADRSLRLKLRTALVGSWFVGTVLLLMRTLYISIRLWWCIGRMCPSRDERLHKAVSTAAKRLRVRRRISVHVTDVVDQPAVMGALCPRVLLPRGVAAECSDDELEMIMIHELGHVRRGDIAVSWLMAGLRAVHWFNPAVHFASRRLAAERELACDAIVLSADGWNRCREYGHLLLRMAERATGPSSQRRPLPTGTAGIVCLFERNRLLKERISMLKRTHHPPRCGRRMLACGLLLAMTSLGLTDAVTHADVPTKPADDRSLADAEPRSLDTTQLRTGDVSNDQEYPVVYALDDLVQQIVERDNINQEAARRFIESAIQIVDDPARRLPLNVDARLARRGSAVPAKPAPEATVPALPTAVAVHESDTKLRWTPANELIVAQTRAVHEKVARSVEFCRSHPLCCLRIDLHLIETPNTPNEIRPKSSWPMRIGTYELDSAEAQRLLEMLRSDGQSKVLMAPRITVLNGQVGIAEVWSERPFDFAGRDGETRTVRLPVAHEGTKITIFGRADGEGQIQLRCELERRFGDGRLRFSGTIVETEDGQWRVVHLWPEANPAANRRNLVLFVKAEKMIPTFED